MYPTISDLLHDLLGLNIPLPIQTFGFFMAIAFAGAYYTTNSELKRREKNGLLKPSKQKVTVNKPVTTNDYGIAVLLGTIVGYKLVASITDYDALVSNPQAFILSTKGSYLGAVLGGAYGYITKKREADKLKGKEPKEIEELVYPHQLMWNILGIAAISGLLGAKIFHNLEYINDFMRDPIDALLSFSGLTFYGGLIVATAAVLYYTHKKNIPTLHMIDAAAPGLMLAYGIGRIGCQMSGDGDWGIVNLAPKPGWMSALPDWMWSFSYPHNVVDEGVLIPGCAGNHCYMLEQPVFPTPFYEVVMALALFGLLWGIRKRITIPGMLFSIYLIVNGIERFLIEQIRVNSTYNIFGHAITQAELISSFMILAGIAGVIYFQRKAKTLTP